jgi:phage shock protein C
MTESAGYDAHDTDPRDTEPQTNGAQDSDARDNASNEGRDGHTGHQNRPLRLDRANRKVLGVCAGLARYLDVPPALVRIIYCIACIVSPVLVIAYLVVYWLLQDDDRAARIQASINRTIKSGGNPAQSRKRQSTGHVDPEYPGMEEEMYADEAYETYAEDPLYSDQAQSREGFRINKPLYRSRRNVRLAGVCAGLAQYLGVSTFFVRLATLLALFILGPVAFWTYVVLWIVLDKEPIFERKRKGKRRHAAQQSRHAAENEASRAQRKQDIEDCLAELKATDQRLQQVEAYMTSKQFRLHCEINRI